MVNRFDALYDFLCDRLKGYPKDRESVDTLSGLPQDVAAFWQRIGFMEAFATVLQKPATCSEAEFNRQRGHMGQLGIPHALIPRCPLILSDDHYSVWYLDLDDATADPPVLGLNSDMPAPMRVAETFSRFAVQHLVTVALQQSPRLLIAPATPLAAEPLFPELHPALTQRGGVIALPFDDSEGVDDNRIHLCFQSMDALIGFCDWSNASFEFISGYLEPGQGRGKLKTIRFEGLTASQLPTEQRIFAEDGAVAIHIAADPDRTGWFSRPTEAPADRFLLTCNGKTAASWVAWIETQGGRVTKIDNKTPKKK
ncbi:hypothetical protein [Acanthopleuribacter pedis]|uniref:Uncharacterized protein n=1 Tax=Acanthopleuribacter pedis TaxID=442870 RepID=A0A8J7U3I8_9BACT|nr:hypothetical protein [Acanthopleuribacter pedis]MBO1320463.1 hypothetical protein [Acanthopleuribacter pedis]